MDCSTPSLPVHHQLPEFTQTHVHPVSDAIHKDQKLKKKQKQCINLLTESSGRCGPQMGQDSSRVSAGTEDASAVEEADSVQQRVLGSSA